MKAYKSIIINFTSIYEYNNFQIIFIPLNNLSTSSYIKERIIIILRIYLYIFLKFI